MTTTARAKASPRPADVLTGRPWLVRNRPFPHYTSEETFEAGFYADLVRQFRELHGRGLAETVAPDKFSRISGFDAYSLPLQCVGPGTPLSLFTSRPWHDLLARVAGVPGTGHVRAALHHHLPGSADGGVHNDFNPGYFEAPADPDEVVMPGRKFSYHTGFDQGGRTGTSVVATVRALAVLIYINNPGWRSGDGGETALYLSPLAAPAVLTLPKDNSMLLFECTPASYHCFRSNRTHPRNSVIMWLHRPWHDAVRRWGEKAIVRW